MDCAVSFIEEPRPTSALMRNLRAVILISPKIILDAHLADQRSNVMIALVQNLLSFWPKNRQGQFLQRRDIVKFEKNEETVTLFSPRIMEVGLKLLRLEESLRLLLDVSSPKDQGTYLCVLRLVLLEYSQWRRLR